MNLKESYRYANYLDSLLETAYEYIENQQFVATTQEKHLRRKANSEAEDETVIVPKPYDASFTPMEVIDFAVKVMAEKEALAAAIADAKAGTEIHIDNAIAANKMKQRFANELKIIVNIKPSTRTVQGSGYKFNAEGNQVKYYYDIEETTTIDFNRNDVRGLVKKYLKEADQVSAKLDQIEINTIVDFVPQWDVNDNFEDVIAAQ